MVVKYSWSKYSLSILNIKPKKSMVVKYSLSILNIKPKNWTGFYFLSVEYQLRCEVNICIREFPFEIE